MNYSVIADPLWSRKRSTPEKSGYRKLESTWTITAFYKGESQEKNLPGDGREQGSSTYSPAHVLLGGSGGFLFLQIHFSVVTTPSASDAIKQCG